MTEPIEPSGNRQSVGLLVQKDSNTSLPTIPAKPKVARQPTVVLNGQELPLLNFLEEDRKKNQPHFLPSRVDIRDVSYSIKVGDDEDVGTISRLLSQWSKYLPFRSEHKTTKTILNKVSFSLLPFETTAILGAPKSGKTTLFEVIAGRTEGGDMTGKITFGSAAESHDHKIGYIPQGDSHVPALTVKETLWFAARLQMPEHYSDFQVSQRVDVTMQILGLSNSADTIIGDKLLERGVSGGERRRVTIGVELVKGPNCVLLDEPTTGLDSSTALGVGEALRTISRSGPPVCAALLQPSWELLNTFDRLLLLSKGQVVYWGPVREALTYFSSLGYLCPAHYNGAEFLAEVIEQPMKFRDADLGQAETDFAAAWLSSELRAAQLVLPAVKEMKGRVAVRKCVSGIGTQLRMLTWRGWVIMRRQATRQLLNMASQLVIAVWLLAVFFNLGTTQEESTAKLAVAFFSVVRGTFNAIAFLPLIVQEKELFFKQRELKYFSTFPYVATQFLFSLPFFFVETVMFGSIVYWGTGMPRALGPFLFYLLVIMLSSLNFISLIRVCCATFSTVLGASQVATAILAIYYLLSGFMISRRRPPSVFLGIFFSSPMSYAIDAIVINTLYGETLTCKPNEFAPPTNSTVFNTPYPNGTEGFNVCPFTRGEDLIGFRQFHVTESWKWFDVLFLGVFGLLLITVYYLLMRFWAKPIKVARHQVTTGPKDRERTPSVYGKQKRSDTEISRPPGSAEFVLTWEDLTFTIKGKTIVRNISGYVKSGMVLALMGPSGAGKTTVLDLLARRKTSGDTEGTVLLNGVRADREAFTRMIGYVEQEDLHFPSQTVLEAIEFAAECRLPNHYSRAKRSSVVNRVLDLLDLRSISDVIVRGLTKEERKRLTIGVELAADPHILFLDEPTTSLDSAGAERVMSAIEKVAASGTACICAIHQPSTRLFLKFSHLLLLRKGEQVYFGPLGNDFDTVLGYFAKQGIAFPEYSNPAEFVLESAGAGIEGRGKHALRTPSSPRGNGEGSGSRTNINSGTTESLSPSPAQNQSVFASAADTPSSANNTSSSVALLPLKQGSSGNPDGLVFEVRVVKEDAWQQSEEMRQLRHDLRTMQADSAARAQTENLRGTSLFAIPLGRQFVVNLKRWTLGWWRSPLTFALLMIRSVVLGLVFGGVYWDRPHDQLSIIERLSALYFLSAFANLNGLATLPIVFEHKLVYHRERSSSMYRTIAYGAAWILVELPNIAFSAICFGTPFYWMAGLRRSAGNFFFFLLVIWQLAIASAAFAEWIAALAHNSDTAGLLYTILYACTTMTAGFYRKRDSIPVYLKWVYHSNFMRYSLEALNCNEFHHMPQKFTCKDGGYKVPIMLSNGTGTSLRYCPFTTGDQFLKFYGFDNSRKWISVGALFGFWAVFMTFFFLCLRFIRYGRR